MVSALVAAAGTGDRFGGESPKALLELAGKPLASWCLAALAGSRRVEQVVVAAPPGFEDSIAAIAAELQSGLTVEIVTGGASRSHSVASALAAVEGASIVVVHDAARPLVTAELIDACVEALENWNCDGVVAAAPATDTIKVASADARVSATLERRRLWAVQTPQVFKAPALRHAFEATDLENAYDDAQLVETTGGDVRIVEAPRENLKITTPIDMRLAELILKNREARP